MAHRTKAKPPPGAPAAGEFRANLLAWFDVHKRDLPWRRTTDPYAIWVSEIMLQQTRVAAVLDHYAIWMRRFPTVQALASASEEDVLTAWSGLGYYRRARFLHQGAKAVVAGHGGKLPESSVALRGLPGIGAYTSAAVASIAFGESIALVDGNVERVLLRQSGNAETGAANTDGAGFGTLNAAEIQSLASRLIDPARPGDFNQAMIEIGATVCLPRNPLCLQCPVQKSCRTRGEHPTAPRKPSITSKIVYGLARRRKKNIAEVLLEQRSPQATIMPGLWELPSLAPDFVVEESLLTLRHAIMQTNYRVAVVELPGFQPEADHQRWTPVAQLPSLPLTGLARKIFLHLGMLTRPS